MTNFDQRLRDAGISTDDVETQIQSAETALLLTAREIVLLEPHRIQRGRLRDITGVKIIKTGELSVRSATESMIEGNVLGFEKTERKLFFDAVKEATARAKASVTNATLAPSVALANPVEESRTSADDWKALMGATDLPPEPVFNEPVSTAEIADFESANTAPLHSVAPDPFKLEPISAADQSVAAPRSSEPDFAPNIGDWQEPVPPAEEDPWMSSKQTFEVEPEKPAAPPAPWLAGDTDPANDVSEGRAASGDAANWSDPFAPNSAVSTAPLQAVTGIQTSNDWGGDTLEASQALGGLPAKSDLERKVSSLGGDNISTLGAISRWLKIMAVLFFLSGTAFAATLFPKDASDVLGYLVLIPVFFGSILFSMIAWGLSELMSAYAVSAQELKAIRRSTLGY